MNDFKLIVQALEKAQSRGAFTMQEVGAILNAIQKVGAIVAELDVNDMSVVSEEVKAN